MKLVGTISRFVTQTVLSENPLQEVEVDLDLLSKQAIRISIVRGLAYFTGVTFAGIYCAKTPTTVATMSKLKYNQIAFASLGTLATRPFSSGSEDTSHFSVLTDRIGTGLVLGFHTLAGVGSVVFEVEIVIDVYDLTADEYIATL